MFLFFDYKIVVFVVSIISYWIFSYKYTKKILKNRDFQLLLCSFNS